MSSGVARPPDMQGSSGDSARSTRATATAAPQPPLRRAEAVRQSRDNATAMLGAGPTENPTVDPQEGGPDAMAIGAVAGAVSSFREIDSQFAGLIPPEVMQFVESLMQTVPQLCEQRRQGGMAGGMASPGMAAMGGAMGGVMGQGQGQGQPPGQLPAQPPGGMPGVRPPMAA